MRRRIAGIDKTSRVAGIFTDVAPAESSDERAPSLPIETNPQRLLADLRDRELPVALPDDSVYDYTVGWLGASRDDPAGFDPQQNAEHHKYLCTVVDDVVAALATRMLDDFASLPGAPSKQTR